jgi:hypothetical protein
MNATVLKLGLLGALLAVGVAAPWQIWRRAQLQVRAKSQEIQRQAAGFEASAAENERLSNLVAQAAKDSLSTEQFRELLRLRGEIGTLRQAVVEIEKLRARNERARERLAKSATPPPPPDPAKVQVHWTKDQLAMAGYADPASAVQTTLWAMTHNDPSAFAAGVTSNANSRLTREQWYNHGPPAEELASATQKIADSLSADTGFDVVGQEFPAEDQARVAVYFDGEGQTRKFFMQRVTGEWKFDSLGNAWP